MAAKKKQSKKKTTKSVQKNKGGRPPSYNPEVYPEQVKKLCLLGAIDLDIANFFGVQESTINVWKKKYKEFAESIKEGKYLANANVASRLYNRAMGYSHVETKIATHEGVITDSQEFIKHYPPDTTACIFWLKNRDPENWRDVHKVEGKIDHTGTIEHKVTDSMNFNQVRDQRTKLKVVN